MIRLIFILIAAICVSAQDVNEQFINSANSFTADMYKHVTKGVQGNVMISPASIQSAVALTMFGATRETQNEMLSGLKYPTRYSTSKIAENYKSFNDYVEQSSALKIANKIYVMKGFSFRQKFQEVAEQSFHSEGEAVDFEQAQKSADIINAWVAEKTENHINKIIESDSLDEYTRMVVVNAIFFKGTWKYKFDKEATKKAPFYLNEQRTVETDFMSTSKDFKYDSFEDIDATVVELPYNGTDITMMIILPNSRTGLSNLEKKLSTMNFKEMSEAMRTKKVHLEMPKFKFEFEVKLNEALENMGMRKMFSRSAEFENLLNQAESVKISEFVHKAYIEVDEKGTRAAAVTRGRAKSHKIAPYYHPMKVDHPFLFVLKSPTSTLFIGRVVNF